MSNTQPPDHTATIAGLSREVETLARQLTTLTAQLDQHEAEAETTRNRVEQLGAYVTRVAQTAAQQAGDKDTGAFTWLGYDGDPDTAAAMLRHLVEWVHGVYLQYTDARKTLPACWLLHPDIIEELQVLRAAWVHAFGPHARPFDPIDWHDRQRPGVERHVRIYARSCSADLHHPGVTGWYNPRPEPVAYTNLIPDVAAWWTGDRTQPPPEPPPEQAATGQHSGNGHRN